MLFSIALPQINSGILLRGFVGAAVFALAYDGGTFDLVSRHVLAIAVWWTVLLLTGLRLLPRGRLSGAGLVTAALLACFALVTLVSVAWAPSAEGAFAEFDRVALYLGVFLLALLAGGAATAPALADGIALGLVAVAGVALVSRFFPGTFSTHAIVQLLPGTEARLTFPVDYWNGLAILLALGVPLLLRAATAAPSAVARGLALAPVPAVVSAIYLTSSRGGVAAALVGVVVFLALTAGRWRALAAIAVGALGSGLAVAVLLDRHALVDGPLGSHAAANEGHSAAALVALVCVLAGIAHGLASAWRPRLRLRPAAGWAVFALAIALVAAAAALAHPVQRFHEFKQPPTATQQTNFIQAHLLSGRGNGRWQFWTSAIDEFRDRPLLGHGAGSYESWWAQHGSISYFVRDAHSLYLETLGELGLFGFVLLAGAFLFGFAGSARSALQARAVERATVAAPTAAFAAYAVGAGVDWMWELTVVSVVGVACLALAYSTAAPLRRPSWAPGRRARISASVAAGTAILAIVVAEAIPLLSELELRDSEAAARRGDTSDALADAAAAHDIQPWAASPYLQYALVEEASGQVRKASVTIRKATDRSSSDWRLWLVAARIEIRSGDLGRARRSIRRAIALNPRSPFFASRRP